MHRLPRRTELARHLRLRHTVEHLQNRPIPVLSHPIGGSPNRLIAHRTSIKPDRQPTAEPVKDV
jgi:hypothetical protein